MNGPMMTGMMAKDADVAWICAMIPHHQGAIDMARAGLKGADNIESKKLAEETIQSQEKEIAKLVTWVEKRIRRTCSAPSAMALYDLSFAREVERNCCNVPAMHHPIDGPRDQPSARRRGHRRSQHRRAVSPAAAC